MTLELPHDSIRPLRRTEYDALIRLGAFRGERLELVLGRIVRMNPQRPPHASTTARLDRLLQRALAERAEVRVQLPLAISEDSEPEPDIAIVPIGAYDDEHPKHAHLVIEVADTSIAFDEGTKAKLYATAMIKEYWVVNLVDSLIERFTAPSAAGYGSRTLHHRGDALSIPGFPDVMVAVDDVLPPARAAK